MRVLVEIVHPADALFFQRPIQRFLERGDQVIIASRNKDVACNLLDGFGFDHQPISTAASGAQGLVAELVRRNIAIWRMVRRHRPQVMLGFGGVAISHVGRLTGVPSAVYYDSENARLQTRIAWPFVHSLTVPEDYSGPTPAGRTRRLPGVKELSFFHPGAFTPDLSRAIAAGMDPERRNVLIRKVAWRANHDLGKSGWSAEAAERLVASLPTDVKLHVSAEDDAPDALKPHIWRGDPAEAHHLMAHCDALIGESATMASEAAVLGVPSLYAGVDFPGYTQGLGRRGLVTLITPDRITELPDATAALLADRRHFDAARAEWLADAPDWADYIVAEADRMARRPW